jgi:hypothetical protein
MPDTQGATFMPPAHVGRIERPLSDTITSP